MMVMQSFMVASSLAMAKVPLAKASNCAEGRREMVGWDETTCRRRAGALEPQKKCVCAI